MKWRCSTTTGIRSWRGFYCLGMSFSCSHFLMFSAWLFSLGWLKHTILGLTRWEQYDKWQHKSRPHPVLMKYSMSSTNHLVLFSLYRLRCDVDVTRIWCQLDKQLKDFLSCSSLFLLDLHRQEGDCLVLIISCLFCRRETGTIGLYYGLAFHVSGGAGTRFKSGWGWRSRGSSNNNTILLFAVKK